MDLDPLTRVSDAKKAKSWGPLCNLHVKDGRKCPRWLTQGPRANEWQKQEETKQTAQTSRPGLCEINNSLSVSNDISWPMFYTITYVHTIAILLIFIFLA